MTYSGLFGAPKKIAIPQHDRLTYGGTKIPGVPEQRAGGLALDDMFGHAGSTKSCKASIDQAELLGTSRWCPLAASGTGCLADTTAQSFHAV